MELESCACLRLVSCWLARLRALPQPDARAQDGQHGQGHAENHDWYKDLKQPQTGYSCCNGRTGTTDGDCRPTRAYLNDDGMWYALLDGTLGAGAAARRAEAARARRLARHICASKSGMIYCFLGGSPKI